MKRLALIVVAILSVAATERGPWRTVGKGTPTLLLHQNNFLYQGAFNLPCNRTDSSNSCTAITFDGLFHYGALGFNPAHNSLFVSGAVKGEIAEVTIPALINSTDYSTLNRASYIQNLVEATGGLIYTVEIETSNSARVGGLLVKGSKLIGTVYGSYDAGPSQSHSHFISDTTLNQNLTGPFAINGTTFSGLPTPGYTSAYMAEIPPEWQSSLGGVDLTGNACISVQSRTSDGPGAYSTDLLNLASSPLSYQLLGYSPIHYLDAPWGTSGVHTTYNGTCGITGVLFPINSASVLFFGKIGTTAYCYGQGTTDPALDETPVGDGFFYCYDPVDPGSKGDHTYGGNYAFKVWAYKVTDLIRVKAGLANAYDLLPYDEWYINFPQVRGQQEIIGVSYDKATGRVFMMQQLADGGNKPTVHVFTLQ